jgi:hypothetical protein
MAIDAHNFSHAELDILQGMGEPIGERERRRASEVVWERADRSAWMKRDCASKPTADDVLQRRLAADLMRDVQRRRRMVA